MLLNHRVCSFDFVSMILYRKTTLPKIHCIIETYRILPDNPFLNGALHVFPVIKVLGCVMPNSKQIIPYTITVVKRIVNQFRHEQRNNTLLIPIFPVSIAEKCMIG